MRKRPTQQRAKIIVDDILQATQLCITQYGLNQVTTPKISEKSGVSVGSIYQYFENKEQIIAELLLRKTENLGQQLKLMVMAMKDVDIQDIITFSIEFGFEALKVDQGFFIEILKNWYEYVDSDAAQTLEKHFFEVGIYLFNQYYQQWNFETLKHKSFVIINSTLFTMVRYVSQNNFLIQEEQLKKELSMMIMAYLKAEEVKIKGEGNV